MTKRNNLYGMVYGIHGTLYPTYHLFKLFIVSKDYCITGRANQICCAVANLYFW